MSMTQLQEKNLRHIPENLAYDEKAATIFAQRFGFPVRVSTLESFRSNSAHDNAGKFISNEPDLRSEIKRILGEVGEPALIVRIAERESRVLDIINRAKTYKENIFPITFFPLGIGDHGLPDNSRTETQRLCFDPEGVSEVFEKALKDSPDKKVFVLSNEEPFHYLGLA